MITCRSCGAENPEAARFCGSCGAPLGATACRACGAANPPTNRFCGQCGTELDATAVPAAPAASVDERKLATVLFADVVGFTSLAERSDPEAVARTVDAAFRRLGEIVAEHGGTIDKYMGDSLMAVFGAPQTHDDDAERAVAAALAMRKVGGDLAFSIGVNTGEVMVTSLGRDGAPTVVGDAVNVAARLEKEADAGEVLAGELTARLAHERVVWRKREAVLLKGKREPVEVFEAVALRSTGDTTTAGERPPLIGRDDELDFLRSRWRHVVRYRRAAVVLLVGEAGVGTTRLAQELAAEVETDALTAWATYPAYGGMGGPRVAAEIALALGPLGDPEVDARVDSLAGRLDPTLKEIDPSGFQQEQAWAFRRLLEDKAAERPVLMVIDDAHRAGEQSLYMIGQLIARVTDVPVLLVLIGRPDPPEWLRSFPTATTLRLEPLSVDDAGALVNTLVTELPLSEESAEFLVRRSGGNALYLRELVALAKERGDLRRRGDAYELDASTAVPATLKAVVAARLDSLSPPEKLALQHAAVLGEASSPARVEALGLEGAQDALDSLASAGLLTRHADTYQVTDPMLAEVAYEALPHHVRAERHRLAARHAATAEERARHLERALIYLPDDEGLVGEAAAALAEAGEELLDAYRHLDGVRLLRRAVELGDERPETLLRLAETLGTVGEEHEVNDVLARLPADAGPLVEARRVHLSAASAIFGDPERAAEGLEDAARRWAELGNDVKEAWAHANRGVALFTVNRTREASAAFQRALPLFRQAADRGGEYAVYSFLGLVRPDDPEVPRWLEEGLRYAEEIGDRSRQVGALVPLAWHHFMRGRLGGPADTRAADDYAARLEQLTGELSVSPFRVQALCLRADLSRLDGRLGDARAFVEEARSSLDGTTLREELLADAVLFELGVAEGTAGASVPEPIDSVDPVVGLSAVIVGGALALGGRPSEALAYFDGARRFPDLGPINPLVLGPTSGLAHLLAGNHEAAAAELEPAVAAADAMRSRPGAAATRGLLAEALVRSGSDRARARQILDGVPQPVPGGVAGACVLRARAVLGDDDARAELGDVVTALRVPGLGLAAAPDR